MANIILMNFIEKVEICCRFCSVLCSEFNLICSIMRFSESIFFSEASRIEEMKNLLWMSKLSSWNQNVSGQKSEQMNVTPKVAK